MDQKSAQTFHVAPTQANQTLAAALRQWFSGQSWSQVRKLIESRRVSVNGNPCPDPARRLKANEVVKVLAAPSAPPPREEDVRTRFLDAHVVVIEKPAGVTTLRHPEEQDWPKRRKQLQPTLDELLARRIALEEGRRPRPGTLPRLRPVHRLDRETSGLMVFARTVEAERHLGHQFRKHTVHRRYLAIVVGQVQAQTVVSDLVRDRGDGRRGSTTLPNVGKRAVTHVKPLEELRGYTLIECRLETGRTHQIRIHLAELGHPVCGEKVYNRQLFGPVTSDPSGAPRIALHAAELGFEHPVTGEQLSFKMPLPSDLQRLLARIRKESQGQASGRG
jgi:23S rRNA pseudouridine1911/1915/1917 synthase